MWWPLMSLKGMLKMEFYIREDYLVPNGFFQDGLERFDKFSTMKKQTNKNCILNVNIISRYWAVKEFVMPKRIQPWILQIEL